MKAFVMLWLLLLSLSLKANQETGEDAELDEAFLNFLSEWGQTEEALNNMVVFDTLLEKETANTEKTDSSKSKEVKHEH